MPEMSMTRLATGYYVGKTLPLNVPQDKRFTIMLHLGNFVLGHFSTTPKISHDWESKDIGATTYHEIKGDQHDNGLELLGYEIFGVWLEEPFFPLDAMDRKIT